jgi:nitrous oxidase accessory protein NosD
MRTQASTAALVAACALGALGAFAPRVAHATPGLDACTGVLGREAGTTTPIIVDTPGTWCLDHDLVESVDAVDATFSMIMVKADDVTIDCRGHRIEYSGAASLMNGIATFGGFKRVTVRNCHFSGFSKAIATGNQDGFLVEDNTVHASRPDYTGRSTSIDGYGSGTIRRNRIYGAVAKAIHANGSSQVLDNLIDGIARPTSGGYVIGVELYAVDGAQVRGNTVRGLPALPALSQDKVVQIDDSITAARTLVADNVFVHDGSEGDIAVFCAAANVRVSDNVISGFFAPTTGCATVADNDISP